MCLCVCVRACVCVGVCVRVCVCRLSVSLCGAGLRSRQRHRLHGGQRARGPAATVQDSRGAAGGRPSTGTRLT